METMEKVVYLDNAATTACAPEVLAVMTQALSGACGNPSSHYSVGYEAKEFVDTGRAQVAKAINASPAEIFFTGCGSEADNWAVKGTAFTKARQNKKHLITSAFEHHAIMHSMAALERMGFEVTYIKPTPEGYIRPEDVEAAIRPDTALVSIMMANNEIGTIQPIKEIAEIAHKHGVWMHTDAVQAVGTIPVDVKELGVDMLSMSAHKFNGPKGMGALYCRKGVWPQNLIDGGSQEARHRAGTENVAGIAAMGKALEIATAHLDERMAHESELRDYVIDRVLKNIPEARLNGGRSPRLPNNVNISFPGLEGETILLDLDMHGICASTGSACNSDSLDPSHVLLSIGLPEEIGGYPIYPDFRNMIQFERALADEKLPDAAKVYAGFQLLFEKIPPDFDDAVQKLFWFYCGGAEETEAEKRRREATVHAPRAYDFDKDAALIYSAFRTTYNIDLATVDFLHWWEFRALLFSLPDTTPMGRIIYYRTVDISEIKDRAMKKAVQKQKDHWKLEPLIAAKKRSPRAMEQDMKERMRRRSEQIHREMEEARRKEVN